MALTFIKSTGIANSQAYVFGSANVTGNVVAGSVLTNSLLYANGSPYVTASGGVYAPNVPGINRIINGAMNIDQRNAGSSQTITAAAALAYTVDRWYAYCTGANVTGQRVANTGTTTAPSQYAYQFTGAASVTAIGFAQRIEAVNCYDLAGTTATLSVNLSNSVLTTVTWTAYYANTADTFGTLASPTRTQIATGTFTVTSTITRYSTQITVPSAATTGIEIVFTVGAQTSGTWVIGNVQLEAGSMMSYFERRLIGQELLLCYRYCYSTSGISSNGSYNAFQSIGTYNSTSNIYFTGQFPVPLRILPSLTLSGSVGSYGAFTPSSNAYTPLTGLALNSVSTTVFYLLTASLSSATGITNSPGYLTSNNGSVQSSVYLIFTAEL